MKINKDDFWPFFIFWTVGFLIDLLCDTFYCDLVAKICFIVTLAFLCRRDELKPFFFLILGFLIGMWTDAIYWVPVKWICFSLFVYYQFLKQRE